MLSACSGRTLRGSPCRPCRPCRSSGAADAITEACAPACPATDILWSAMQSVPVGEGELLDPDPGRTVPAAASVGSALTSTEDAEAEGRHPGTSASPSAARRSTSSQRLASSSSTAHSCTSTRTTRGGG